MLYNLQSKLLHNREADREISQNIRSIVYTIGMQSYLGWPDRPGLSCPRLSLGVQERIIGYIAGRKAVVSNKSHARLRFLQTGLLCHWDATGDGIPAIIHVNLVPSSYPSTAMAFTTSLSAQHRKFHAEFYLTLDSPTAQLTNSVVIKTRTAACRFILIV